MAQQILHQGRVKCLGTNRSSLRRFSLFKRRTDSLLTVTKDEIVLFRSTTKSKFDELTPRDLPEGKILGTPQDVLSVTVSGNSSSYWVLSLIDSAGKTYRYQFQCETAKEASIWLDTLESLKQQRPVVVVVGNSGVGKSLLCSALTGLPAKNDTFKVSNDLQSGSSETVTKPAYWFGDNEQEQFVAVDTPGLGDSKGKDSKNIAQLAKQLRLLGNINTIVVLINAQSPRLDASVTNMLHVFEQLFGPQLWAHACIAFTRWNYSTNSEKKRKQGVSRTKEQLAKEWNNELVNEFPMLGLTIGVDRQIPCYFLDTETVMDMEKDTPEVNSSTSSKATQAELQRFSIVARTMPSFCVENIVLPENEIRKVTRQNTSNSRNSVALSGSPVNSGGENLLLFLQRAGLQHHHDNLVAEGIYSPSDLQMVPKPFLIEMGFTEEEFSLLKPNKAANEWHQFENTHERLVAELNAAKIRFTNRVLEHQVTLGELLKVPLKELKPYLPRIKDRLRFNSWRQTFLAGKKITSTTPLWNGAIVERGVDWCYDLSDEEMDPQDGGSTGSPGRVLGWHTLQGEKFGGEFCPKYPGWVTVRWTTTGAAKSYRMGLNDKFDLSFLSNPEKYDVVDSLVAEKLEEGTELQTKHLRRSFGYPLGRKYAYWSTFDVRDEICTKVGGFKHGQLVRFKQDNSLHVCIGVGLEDHKPQLYFHPKDKDFAGAGMFAGIGPQHFTVIGEEEVQVVKRKDMEFHFDDDIDNDTLEYVRANLKCDFPYLAGTQLARSALFDVRDEMCLCFGHNLRSGDTLKNRLSGTKMWVVGVKNDDENIPRLWFHIEGVEGAGVSREFHSRMSEYERLDTKTILERCETPVGVTFTPEELQEIASQLDLTYSFPRGVGQNTQESKFDTSSKMCVKLCGHPSGTVFEGPDGAKITVIGVALDMDNKTPRVWFHHQNHLGAGQIPEFVSLQHHFQKLDEVRNLDDLRREIEERRNRQEGPNAMMLLNLLRQQFHEGSVGADLQQVSTSPRNTSPPVRDLFSGSSPIELLDDDGDGEDEEGTL